MFIYSIFYNMKYFYAMSSNIRRQYAETADNSFAQNSRTVSANVNTIS